MLFVGPVAKTPKIACAVRPVKDEKHSGSIRGFKAPGISPFLRREQMLPCCAKEFNSHIMWLVSLPPHVLTCHEKI